MKRRIFATLLLVCSVVFCLAAMSGLDGKWLAQLKPGDGSTLQVTYTFKTNGAKFSGDVQFPGSDFPITGGIIKGDSIQFFVTLNGRGIPNYGRLYTDSIGLDIAMNGKKYHNTLMRAK